MNTATVRLAGRDYELKPLPVRRNAEWRKKATEPLEQISGLISTLTAPATEDAGDNGNGVAEGLASGLGRLDLAQLVPAIRTVIGSPDLIADLLFDYSPVLQADRERIEAEGYDEEVMAAFMVCLGFAFPFGVLVERLFPQLKSSPTSPPSTN